MAVNPKDNAAQPHIIVRALLIWLVLICAEIVHGIMRAILLVPMVGEFRSNQIGVFTGSAIILVIAYFAIRWIGAKRTSELLMVGLLWLLLALAFEVLFGRFVRRIIVKEGRYRHYKGEDYIVIGIARHSETEEELVVYRQDYGEKGLWVRPLAMFLEVVELDGKQMPRFEFIGEK